MCRDHRHLTTCQKQHRQNEPAGRVDIPTRVEVHVMGNPDTCRDHRCPTTFQKQHRQYEPAGQVDIATLAEVRVTVDPWTHVGTTDVSPHVKNNTDRMNQLVEVDIPTGVEVCVMGIPHMCRDHRHLTTCQKQHRQNEPAVWVNVFTWVEICVMGNPDTFREHRHLTACQKQHRQYEPAGWVDIATVGEVSVTVDPGHV